MGIEATSVVRDGLPDEEVVGRVDKINCTYPIDFNPWILKKRFKILMPLVARDRHLLVPLQALLDFIFPAQWNTIQSELHGGRIR